MTNKNPLQHNGMNDIRPKGRQQEVGQRYHLIYKRKIPPHGTPPWDAYPDADAEYYDLYLVSDDKYKAAPATETFFWTERESVGRFADLFPASKRLWCHWYNAIDAIFRADLGPFTKLLHASRMPPSELLEYIADALETCTAQTRSRSRGRPKVSIGHRVSETRAKLMLAKEFMKVRRSAGESKQTALENSLLIMSGRDHTIRGDKRSDFLLEAEKELGITQSSLSNDLKRGRR